MFSHLAYIFLHIYVDTKLTMLKRIVLTPYLEGDMDLCSSARECDLMEVIRKRVCVECDVAWMQVCALYYVEYACC